MARTTAAVEDAAAAEGEAETLQHFARGRINSAANQLRSEGILQHFKKCKRISGGRKAVQIEMEIH